MNDSASPPANPVPAAGEPGPIRRWFGRRLVRYPLFALAAFLAVCGICAVTVPLLVEHVVLARAGETIGRPMSVERVRFNPFTLELSARGLHVAGPEPGTQFVDVDELRIDLSLASVRYLAPVVDALSVIGPRIRLERTGERRFSFSDIVDRLRAMPPKKEADAPPARFALHDIELSGGEVTLDDRFLKQQHAIRNLKIGVPFVSNLDYAIDITVQPALSATVNGSPLNLTGKSLPFSATRDTSIDIDLSDVDIATYLRLSPVPLGFTVPKGRLTTALKVTFSQEAGVGKLGIGGTSRIDDLQIDARAGGRLLAVSRIALGLDGIEPLAGRYAFGELAVDGLDMTIERDAGGRLPLARAFMIEPAQQAAGTSPAAASSVAGRAEGSEQAAQPAAEPLRWSLRETRLQNGRIAFNDHAVSPAVELVHSGIALELGAIGSEQTAPAPASLSLTQGESSRLAWRGELDVGKARAAGRLDATVAGIGPYLPYLAAALAPKTRLETGGLAAQGAVRLDWADDFELEVTDAKASLQRATLTLPDGKEAALAFEQLAAEGVALSLAGRSVTVSRLSLAGADVRLERDAKGQLNLLRAMASSPAAAAAAQAQGERKPNAPREQAKSPETTAASAWSVKIDRIDLDRNQVAWHDLMAARPVSVPITRIAGRVEQVGTDLSLASKVDLKARVGRAGELTARGDFVIAPWSARLAVQLLRLPLPSIDPYVAEHLTLGIEEGALSTSGQLNLGADRVRYKGRLEVNDLRTRERTTSTEAIRWKSLLLDGIDVDVSPATLDPEDRIAIGGIALRDFFARVLLTEQGRFNLQDLVRTEASIQAQARAEELRKAQAARPATTAAPEADEGARPTLPADDGVRTAPVAQAAARAGPTIRLGPVKLEGGRSNFTDRFVRPNYSVNLTDLEGGLSAMASDDPAPAEMRLAGRIDGEAPIDISGRINPLAQTLFVDVRAEAKGIDLPAFSPYSGKYAGYAIEKGKLSLDVHYRIAQEQLEAQNRVVLDQLTFGDKVDSPDATTLPIQFALGLLKDRNGEIDLNLPIAGSLDDPQFSIGGIIGKAIVNLLTRIITSPFSALAAAFGGGEELSFVDFEPGTADLTRQALERLATLSKALAQRPALKLEIAGRVDPKSERDAMARQRLEARLRALKRRQAGGADAAEEERREAAEEAKAAVDPQASQRRTPARVTIGKEEYPALLRQLYEDTRLPEKPRNALGVARALEVPEMEKLLLGAIEVDGEAVRRLALRRAQVVRDWLAAQGKVAGERMYTLAPRVSSGMTGPGQSKPQCPAHCAEFSLR